MRNHPARKRGHELLAAANSLRAVSMHSSCLAVDTEATPRHRWCAPRLKPWPVANRCALRRCPPFRAARYGRSTRVSPRRATALYVDSETMKRAAEESAPSFARDALQCLRIGFDRCRPSESIAPNRAPCCSSRRTIISSTPIGPVSASPFRAVAPPRAGVVYTCGAFARARGFLVLLVVDAVHGRVRERPVGRGDVFEAGHRDLGDVASFWELRLEVREHP